MRSQAGVRFSVAVRDLYIEIRYDGAGVLYWDRAEWEEDPDLTPQIVNAVVQALSRPGELYRFCVEKGLIAGVERG